MPFHILSPVVVALTLTLWLHTGTARLDAGVAINEFVSSNGGTIADEEGDFEDWIELYNHGSDPINLAGYGLSDDAHDPFRWVFPAVTLAPGEFVVVWASAKDRALAGSPLHTDFRLSASGDTIILTHPDESAVDVAGSVALGRDHSYGRVPDGTGDWYFFTEPTPNAENATPAYDAWLEPPAFSRKGGFYTDEFFLELSTRHPDAAILYTVDGSEPDPSGAGVSTYTYKNQYPESPGDPYGPLLTAQMETRAYSALIPIADRTAEPNDISMMSMTGHRDPSFYMPNTPIFKGTVVRARAVRDGSIPSDIVTQSYFVTPEGANRYSLPVLSVTIPPKALFEYERGIAVYGKVGDDWREQNPHNETPLWQTWIRRGNYTQTGRNWEYPGHLEIFTREEGRAFAQNLGIRVHGGTSRGAPLKSLRFYARRDYDLENFVHYPFFDDIRDIYGNPVDRFKRFITRGSGHDHNTSRFRDMFMQTLLRPLGLDDQGGTPVLHFINGEFWGHTNVRDRIDRYLIAHRHHIDPDDVAMLTHNAVVKDGTGSDRTQYQAMRSMAQTRNMANQADFEAVAALMDMENFILYNMAEIYVFNTDWPNNNIDYWRKRTPDHRPGAPPSHDGRWRWIFVDLDLGFGLYGNAGNAYNAAQDGIRRMLVTEMQHGSILLQQLIANEGFRDRFINAFMDHMATTFQPDRVAALIDYFNEQIAPYRQGEHRERWPSMGANNHVSIMKQFGRDRPGFMRTHLRNHFNLPEPVGVRFDVSDSSHGILKINTITIDENTPGIPDPSNPFPFAADYFPGVPIEVTAIPRPGHRFAGWLEFPDHDGKTITLSPQSGMRVTALFDEGPASRLLAYWNFNDTQDLLAPAYTANDAILHVSPGAHAEATDGGGNGFTGANARGDDPAGRHLRINNPLSAAVQLRLPTTGHGDPVLSYETRRSGSGAGIQLIEFTRDGTVYEQFFDLPVHDAPPVLHRFDFSGIPGVADNPQFRVRITFYQGWEGGLTGNNRIDNVTFEAAPLSGAPPPEYRFGFPVTDERIDTGTYLGSLHVADSPWVYSFRLNNWIYLDPMYTDLSRGNGSWAYVLNPDHNPGAASAPATGNLHYGYPVSGQVIDTGAFIGYLHTEFAPWVYSYRLTSWIFIPDPDSDLRAALGSWVYLPRPYDPAELSLSDIRIDEIGSDSARVRWTTNHPAASRVHYGAAADRLLQTGESSTGNTTDHSVTLSGLTPNRTYFIRAVSVDASNSTAFGEIMSFHTDAVPLLKNNEFSSFGPAGLATDWRLLVHGETDYTVSQIESPTGSAQRIAIHSAPGWGLVFYQEPPFESGRDYEWTIRYMTESANPVSVSVANPPATEVAFRSSLAPTGGEWREVVLQFTWNNPEASQLRVSSSSPAVIAIDRMTLVER